MEFLIHFVFQLVKISILGSFYALFVLLLAILFELISPNSKLSEVWERKSEIWTSSCLIISGSLFIFSFTYWGDHGLGDSARIPIGHYKSVCHGGRAYIEIDKSQISFDRFTYDSQRLYAISAAELNGDEHDILVYDLMTDAVKFYDKEEDYIQIAKESNYPLPATFEEFWVFYKQYWNGWRFFVLP